MPKSKSTVIAVAHELPYKPLEESEVQIVIFSTDPKINQTNKFALRVRFDGKVQDNGSDNLYDNINIPNFVICSAVKFHSGSTNGEGVQYNASAEDNAAIILAIKELIISATAQNPDARSPIRQHVTDKISSSHLASKSLEIRQMNDTDYIYVDGGGDMFGSVTAFAEGDQRHKILFSAKYTSVNYADSYSTGELESHGTRKITQLEITRLRAVETKDSIRTPTADLLAHSDDAAGLREQITEIIRTAYSSN